jgi:DNA helicase-2/ATP-dependent DNA helicase PcrA
MQLNEEQLRAVESESQRILVIASAGTGKTRVLVERVKRLLRSGANPAKMLCVTFTRAAADEMRERIKEEGFRHLPDIRTVHSWCAQLLRKYARKIGLRRNFSIYDQSDSDDLIRAIAMDLGVHDKPMTARLETLKKRPGVMQQYRLRLSEANAIDFDGLETYACELMATDPEVKADLCRWYENILVDEYQDTSWTQAAIFAELDPVNLFVVGDPKQALYSWRGADVENILRLAADKDFEVINLVRNYRSGPEVVRLANHVMGAPLAPMIADREFDSDHFVKLIAGDYYESRFILAAVNMMIAEGYQPSDIAILGRSWKHIRPVYDELVTEGHKAHWCGEDYDPWSSIQGRMVARAITLWTNPFDMNYARMVDGWNGRTTIKDFRRVRIRCKRDRTPLLGALGGESNQWREFQKRRSLSQETKDMDLRDLVLFIIETFGGEEMPELMLAPIKAGITEISQFREWWMGRGLQERAKEGTGDAITVTTVHGSKGLEYRVVILTSAVDGIFPSNRKTDARMKDEDRRIFYVAITRAQDTVILSAPELMQTAWKTMKVAPSPYLAGYDWGEDQGI